MMSRRQFLLAATASAAVLPAASARGPEFRFRYILSSAMYGYAPLDEILPEVAKTGSEAIDLWCKVHGDQREQAAALGDASFSALLGQHKVRLGVSTRYPLGPFKLREEMDWLKRHGGRVLVCGSPGQPSEPRGDEARKAVREFLEAMKPHTARAEELGVVIAVENHDRQLLYHPDSLRHFAELNRSPALGIAFAPHHLHPWTDQIPGLLRDLGARNLPFIYFQQHSAALREKTSREIELQQMPGRGSLDFRPMVRALREIRFEGWAELFMHPTPRGIPVMPTTAGVTELINESRAYMERCLQESA